MTRAIVFSDTHGRIDGVREAILCAGGADAVLHLGDFGRDLESLAGALAIPYYAVRGNCDASAAYPRRQVVTLERARLLLTHGNTAKNVFELSDAARSEHCAAVLFGHTHEPLLQADGSILILNPGSFSAPRFGSPCSYALLEIEGGDVNACICTR